MRDEPQAAPYCPDPAILPLAPWLGDPVAAAQFPEHRLRWRNDRGARSVGLDGLSDADWLAHFAQFAPLPDNLPGPLALRYHGHQFRLYNPQIGDGRGFLFAQLRDGDGRLLDLGTKGSGRTPHSREGDGRLTLKGAVREILATEMLEALGVDTSRTFSVVETGEALVRGDEPSPTRSAVLVRLSHGHIRIGSFQRLAYLGERDHLAALVDYALAAFPGPLPPADSPGRDEPAVILLHQVVERLADLAASYTVAGFVHGVLNSDNMNVSGESFDYGPWRWLPAWDGGFTAAYFDHTGLYAFGRQAEAIQWNCAQLAIALRGLVDDAAPLIAALDRFDARFHYHVQRRAAWRLGVQARDANAEPLLGLIGRLMQADGQSPDAWFAAHRGGRGLSGDLPGYFTATAEADWPHADPPSLVIETVETICAAINLRDDWVPLAAMVSRIRALGDMLGPVPPPAGHLPAEHPTPQSPAA